MRAPTVGRAAAGAGRYGTPVGGGSDAGLKQRRLDAGSRCGREVAEFAELKAESCGGLQ